MRRAIVWPLLAMLLLAAVPLSSSRALVAPVDLGPAVVTLATPSDAALPGDPLPRIQCPPGYTARVYAQGLRSPDGLAFDPQGRLHVAEERAGQVSRIDPAGNITPVLTGLDHPEGIAFDGAGNLYVVEDIPSGRLIKRAENGTTTTLAADLEAPEGVAWGADGALYVTESSIEFAQKAQDLRSRIARVSLSGEVTRLLTDTLTIDGTHVSLNSYAGIVAGPDDRLYVTNELSGIEITRTVVLIPGVLTTTVTLSTTDSVFAVDPAAGTRTLAASGLIAPEGPRFAPGNPAAPGSLAAPADPAAPAFPLYVAEEDTGNGQGRLSVVGASGQPIALCTGFGTIEDVAIDAEGRLYVSEDGNGLVVQITPARTPPETVEISGPAITRIHQGTVLIASVRPLTTTPPVMLAWQATGNAAGGGSAIAGPGLTATTVLTWGVAGPQRIGVTASNAQGTVAATHTLTVYAPPAADFVGTPVRGIAPLTVAFANRSSGEDMASQWDFGDGRSSTAPSPTHTYAIAGAYTVTLTVSGPGGSDTEIKPAYITALNGSFLPLVVRPR